MGVVEDVHPEGQPGDEEDDATEEQHAGRPSVHGLALGVHPPGSGRGCGRRGQRLLVVLRPRFIEIARGSQRGSGVGSAVARAPLQGLASLAQPRAVLLLLVGPTLVLQGGFPRPAPLARRGRLCVDGERLRQRPPLSPLPQRAVDDGVEDDDDEEGDEEEDHQRHLVGHAQLGPQQGRGEVAEQHVVVEVVREGAADSLHLAGGDGGEEPHGRDGHDHRHPHHHEHALVDVVHRQAVFDRAHGHVALHGDGHQRKVGGGDGHVADELEDAAEDVGGDEVKLQHDAVRHDDGTHHQVDDGQHLGTLITRIMMITNTMMVDDDDKVQLQHDAVRHDDGALHQVDDGQHLGTLITRMMIMMRISINIMEMMMMITMMITTNMMMEM